MRNIKIIINRLLWNELFMRSGIFKRVFKQTNMMWLSIWRIQQICFRRFVHSFLSNICHFFLSLFSSLRLSISFPLGRAFDGRQSWHCSILQAFCLYFLHVLCRNIYAWLCGKSIKLNEKQANGFGLVLLLSTLHATAWKGRAKNGDEETSREIALVYFCVETVKCINLLFRTDTIKQEQQKKEIILRV